MIVNCPICSEILLPSDVLCSTPCGHVFHVSCLNRWLSCNATCPQCRSECLQNNVHRIYLPEVNFQDQDQLIERMNEINRSKIECESKLKKIEQEKKSLENELKRNKKEFHRVVQRTINMRKKGTSNIPPRHLKSAAVNCLLGTPSRAHVSKNSVSSTSSSAHHSKKRNMSRVQRSKLYFQRKRTEHRNNNNSSHSREVVEIEDNEVESIVDSPAISVSSDEVSSN